MKHIVDGLGYQEACNGIKCIDCPFLDDEHNCKIGMYIRSQKVYQERQNKEWIEDIRSMICKVNDYYGYTDIMHMFKVLFDQKYHGWVKLDEKGDKE